MIARFRVEGLPGFPLQRKLRLANIPLAFAPQEAGPQMRRLLLLPLVAMLSATVVLSVPLYSIAIDSNSSATAVLSAYDAAGNLIGSDVLYHPGALSSELDRSNRLFGTLRVATAQPMARFTFGGGFWVHFDNLRLFQAVTAMRKLARRMRRCRQARDWTRLRDVSRGLLAPARNVPARRSRRSVRASQTRTRGERCRLWARCRQC